MLGDIDQDELLSVLDSFEYDESDDDEECNTCGGTGRWESTFEDAPVDLIDLGDCPDCQECGE